MRNMKLTVSVECNLTADQWQLYDKNGRDFAAQELNATFAAAVNSGARKSDIMPAMRPVMKKWEDLGAADSEAYHTIEDMMEVAFVKEPSRR